MEVTIAHEESLLEKVHGEHAVGHYRVDDYLEMYLFSHGFISDVLSYRKVKALTSDNPILIDSQTGTGKSTWVFSTLFPVLQERGQRLLILCGRTALASQYKKQAAKQFAPQLLENLTPMGLNRQIEFGDVDIMTYQSLAQRLKNSSGYSAKRYGAVIFDEAHYFVQDAAFDCYTEELLNRCISQFRGALRIYLTATPDAVLESIVSAERNAILPMKAYASIWKNPLPIGFTLYRFRTNYDYVNPIFFTEDDSLVKQICSQQGKVLICVDNKVLGQKLQKKFGDELAEFVDAEMKNNDKSELVDNVIQEEQFKKRIFIVTSFLDVGVNLQDTELKTVVLYVSDPILLKQFLGRKRVKKGENVNVFFFVPDEERLVNRQKGLNNQKRLWEQNVETFFDTGATTEIPFPCFFDLNSYVYTPKYSKFSFHNLAFQEHSVRRLLEAGRNGDDFLSGVAGELLSWLGCSEKLKTAAWLEKKVDESVQELDEYLKSLVGQDMDAKGYDDFRQKIWKIHNAGCCKEDKWRSRNLPSPSTMEKYFSTVGLNYTIRRRDKSHRIELGGLKS